MLPDPYYADSTGSVTVYHGDCLDLLPHVGEVDCIATDPPYLLDFAKSISWSRGDDGPGAHEIDYAPFSPDDVARIGPPLSELPRRWCLVWSDIESTHLWRAALTSKSLRYVRTGLWTRRNPTPQFTGDRPGTPAEAVTICHRLGGKMRWNGGGSAARWDHAQQHGTTGGVANEHPTPKPLALMRELVRLFTDPGELILDPFAGSGTTGLAARLEGRRAILIEREEKYCDLIVRRLERMPRDSADGQRSLFGRT